MRNVRSMMLPLLVAVLSWGFPSPGLWAHSDEDSAVQKDSTITVRVGNAARRYTREQLLAMATETIPNLKGTRKKPAIPLVTILFKDTGAKPEDVEMVFVIGERTTILRGNDLAYLNKLVLATGPDKGGKPHTWSLASKDEEAYKAIHPHMGSRRKGDIYRIDVVLKADAAQDR